MNNKKSYKSVNTFEERKAEFNRVKSRYADRIPLIVENSSKNINIPNIDKNKFLIPYDMTISQLLIVLRKRIKINPAEAIYIFINNRIPMGNSVISKLYEDNKDEDGFLYIYYSGENTFGDI
jgi:GABA(A) receptor-associated protein